MVTFASMPVEKLIIMLENNSPFKNRANRQDSATILPLAVAVGLLTFFVTDSFKGGVTGVQGFFIGVIATFIIFIILAVPGWIASSFNPNREYGPPGENLKPLEHGLSGIPPDESANSVAHPEENASHLEIICPNCDKKIAIDVHLSHGHLHPPQSA